MLVLTRKSGEAIDIGDGVRVTVVRMQKNAVRLGITAPHGMQIKRHEIEWEQPDDSHQGMAGEQTAKAA